MTEKPVMMGILNITPDSFSDGGKYLDPQEGIKKAFELMHQGADIIDIGAESTRPGSAPISSKIELLRLSEVVKIVAKQHFISIDTYKANTAQTCLELGAKMINDVSALRADKEMVEVVRAHKAEIVLMYSKQNDLNPHASKDDKDYLNVISTIREFLSRRIDFALKSGIEPTKIILDPGMGSFISSNPIYSWQVISRIEELCNHFRDFRLLIGTSRKGFLKHGLLKQESTKQESLLIAEQNLDLISQLTAFLAVYKGVKIIRTHNPKMALKFCNVLDS